MILTQTYTSIIDAEKIKAYLSLLSGHAGRLVISVAYFIAIANALSLEDFGLFATASATGVVLSRLAGFGFISPLYRTATVRPLLVGSFTAGFAAVFVLSLPFVFAISLLFYWLIFSTGMSLTAFLWIMAAEIVFWRLSEVAIIVNNGMARYAYGALLTIVGSSLRAIAAVGFFFSYSHELVTWSMLYAGANATCLVIAAIFFYPRQRWRWKPKAYIGRMIDALAVSAADVLFYLQMELDKVVVLVLGGETMAGIYAIIMRLVDLTALPIRAFNTMLVQLIMKRRGGLARMRTRAMIEISIAVVSVIGMAAITILLNIAPGFLGSNIAQASGFLILVLAVPAFRNLVEYHAELLYACEKTIARVIILFLVGLHKAALLILLLGLSQDFSDRALWLNGVFFLLYVLSALTTYRVVPSGKTPTIAHAV